MASRIKGITIELNGDTTGLDKALKGVNGELNSTQKQLKDVDRLLKLDPTNTTLLAQKQRLLGDAVQQSATKLDTLREAQRQLDAQIAAGGEKDVAQYEALQREIAATELQMRNFKSEAESLDKSAASAGRLNSALKQAGESAGAMKAGLAAAAAAAAVGLARGALSVVQYADELQTMSKQSGFTTAELQKMAYAADRVDVSQETIVASAKKLKNNMKSTSAEVTAAWNKIGVSVRNTDGSFRDSNEVFYDTIAALSRVSNETERDTLAMTLFGRSADDLAGIIDDGGDALRKFGTEAEEAGLILNESQLQNLNDINDELDALKAKAKATFGEALGQLLIDNKDLLYAMIDGLADAIEWLDKLAQKVSEFNNSEIGKALINELSDDELMVTKTGSNVARWFQGIASAGSPLETIEYIMGVHRDENGEYHNGSAVPPRGGGGAFGTSSEVSVSINFEGDLAQVGAVLAPSVTAEQRRVGDDLSR